MSKVGIVKIRQATRPSIVSQNYSAKIDISDLSGVNLGGIKEGDILVYSANTGNFEVRTASISGNNDSALTEYAANHANAAFTYANTISGGSAIDNVARVAAASAQSTAGLAYNHANAAFNAANSGSSSVFTQSAYNHANAAFTSANSINGVNTTQNNSITTINAVNVTQNNRITAAFNHANAAFNAANTGGAAGVDTYARNHANAAFAYANTISGGSAIDNVARTSAASAQSTAGLAYNHANAAYDKANSANILAQAAFNTANIANTRTIINGLGNSKLDFNTYGANTAYLTTTSDDSTALFMGAVSADLYARTNILIRANTGGTSQTWTFGEDGTLTFPDATVQSTAFTGSAIDQVARDTANAGFDRANSANTIADASFVKANAANVLAQNAYNYANTLGINVANSLIMVSSVPANNKGAGGDTKGMVYLANDYFYYCTTAYDGTTNIWSRIASTDAW